MSDSQRGKLKSILAAIVVSLPLLLIVYAVVMATAALLNAMGDATGSLVLRWFGTVLAILFTSGIVLLVLLLGYERALRDDHS